MIVTGPAPVAAATRVVGVDRVRGLAIVLMLADHLAYLVGPVEVRLTVGRLAMPLFFLLAGPLVHRLTVRQGVALGLGLALTYLAPWAGHPNVLVLYVAGAAAVVAWQWIALPDWLVVVVALAFLANGVHGAGSFDWIAVLGIMLLGRVIGLGWADRFGSRLPAVLGSVGQRPLTWYVANVLAVQGVIWWLSRA